MAKSNARTAYLISPGFQLKFILYTLVVALITFGVFYLSHLYFVLKFLRLGEELKLAPDHPFFSFLLEQKHALRSVFLITVGLTLPLLLISGLLFSHRVAGPLVKLQRHLDSIDDTKDLRPVKFRKGDFFSEVAESFNRLANRLKK